MIDLQFRDEPVGTLILLHTHGVFLGNPNMQDEPTLCRNESKTTACTV